MAAQPPNFPQPQPGYQQAAYNGAYPPQGGGAYAPPGPQPGYQQQGGPPQAAAQGAPAGEWQHSLTVSMVAARS